MTEIITEKEKALLAVKNDVINDVRYVDNVSNFNF